MDFTQLIAILLNLQQPIHQWQLIGNKHWQIVSNETFPQEILSKNCPVGMIEVQGNMKQDLDPNPWGGKTVEALQKSAACTKWINRDFPERCAEFDRNKWLTVSVNMETKPMHFCIDKYEYPNVKGQYPIIYVSFWEAEKICEKEGKRLCDEEEWTFACEGEEALPYPYGYTRDASACNIDKHWLSYVPSHLRPRYAQTTMLELNRLWQGAKSGEMERCVSPFGVYDLTGNIDEWTTKVRPYGNFKSILHGGYWGPVRTRCRPTTRGHNENHVFYQQGLRCCISIN